MSVEYVVSACLAGLNCRYDGGSRPVERIVELARQGRAVAICPESLSGLPVPREPCEQCGSRIISSNGEDFTDKFEAGAQKAFIKAVQSGARKAILKARSPSCGLGYIYDGTFTKTLKNGHGVFARKLIDAGYECIDEEALEKWGPE